MKLSLIYHVYKNTANLKKSLDSVKNQTDKDYEFILISDGISKQVYDILKKYDFLSFCKNVKFIFFSENQGHSHSFNEALKQCENSYVYYFGSNIVLKPNFVKIVNDVIDSNKDIDVISMSHVIDKKPLMTKFTSLQSDLKYNITPSLRDKIFSRNFLITNNISLNMNGYFPMEFLYKVMLNFKQWLLVNKEIIIYLNNNSFTYNLYDIFQMNNLLIKNYSHTTFWKQNRSVIEFLMILYATRIFLSRIFLSYDDKYVRKGAMKHSLNWLEMNIPSWQKNPILNSKKVSLSEESRERVLNIFNRRFFKKIFGKF